MAAASFRVRRYGMADDMRYREFGADHTDVILLLHGGGLSWWNHRETARLLEKEFRVIVPVLDGHAGSDAAFESMEKNAARLIEWIDAEFGGSVLAIGGVSLGAQVLLEMLAQRGDICRFALAESALVRPSGLTCALAGPAVRASYGLIRQEWFARWQFAYLKLPEAWFADYYRDTCALDREDMVRFLRANSAYPLKDALRKISAKVLIVA